MARLFRALIWVSLIVLAVVLIQHSVLRQQADKSIGLGQFMRAAERGEVKSLTIYKTLGEGIRTEGGRDVPYVVTLPANQDALLPTLLEKVPQMEVKQPPVSEMWVSGLFYLVLTVLLVVAFWAFVLRQTQSSGSQAMSFGRSRARRSADTGQKVTFDDFAGGDEAKAELVEVVEFLRNPRKFQALGARIPRGVLLVGPPGSGKTLLARCVAGEAGVPFFHMSGSEFVEMFVGVGASRVRDLFEQAKANRPCIVFIDEIDAVGRQRFAGLGGGHDEREQTLNQLLVEMDGFDPNSGVILVAATNRPDVLDPALLRPGRFDRRIQVDNPDLRGREAVLRVHSKNKPLDTDVDMEVLARRTPGFSGADLANMVNEAALLAARHNRSKIAMADCEDSIERVLAGPERKSRIISEREKRILAHHEVGHAVLAELLPHADSPHKVSIIQRGMALGYTLQLPTEDRYIMTRGELLDQITVFLGGRAAEELAFQEGTTGAADDFKKTTELARRMVTDFGMSEHLGPMSLGRRYEQPFLGRDIMEDRNYSEQVASVIDQEVSAIIERCYQRARQLLTENAEAMRAVVEVLLEKETLTGDQVRAIMRGEPLPAAPSRPDPPAQGEQVKPMADKEAKPPLPGEQPQPA